MNFKKEPQFICTLPHISANGLFACGIMSDYRTDWVLADNSCSCCLDKKTNITQKES